VVCPPIFCTPGFLVGEKGVFTEACWQTVVVDMAMDMPCIKQSLAKLVSYAILTGSLILKVPQIIKILRAGNAQGLVASSYLSTMIRYALCAHGVCLRVT
jgi:mannose-P-dolichol utilization defect protein 1